MKRILALFLTLVFIMAFVPTAFAAEAPVEGSGAEEPAAEPAPEDVLAPEGGLAPEDGLAPEGGDMAAQAVNIVIDSTNSSISSPYTINTALTIGSGGSVTLKSSGYADIGALGAVTVQSGGSFVVEGGSLTIFDGGHITVETGGVFTNAAEGYLSASGDNPITGRCTNNGGIYYTVGEGQEKAWNVDMGGTGTLVKMGTGTLALAGDTGGAKVHMTGGKLVTGPNLQCAYILLYSGAELWVKNSATVGEITGEGIVRVDSGKVLTIDVPEGRYYELSGAVQGAGGLKKSGKGALALAGNNTFTGGITIYDGTISAAKLENLGAFEALRTAIDAYGGGLHINGDIDATGMPIRVRTSFEIVVKEGKTFTMSYLNSGKLNTGEGIHKRGGGTLAFAGNCELYGNLYVSEGTMRIANDSGVGINNIGGEINVYDGATLEISNTGGTGMVNDNILNVQHGGMLINNGSIVNTGVTRVYPEAEFAETGYFENEGSFRNDGDMSVYGIFNNIGSVTGTYSTPAVLHLDAQGGRMGSVERHAFYAYGAEANRYADMDMYAPPERENANFIGWARTKGGETVNTNRVTFKDGDTLYARWEVYITGLKLDKTKLAMTAGDTAKLTASVLPADATESKAVVWTSHNGNVAVISRDGMSATIQALQPGYGAIYVKTSESGHNAVCEITVKAAPTPVAVSSVKTQKTLYLLEGKRARLPYAVYPADAADQSVVWASNRKRIATVSSKGLVRAKAPGKAVITVKTANGKLARCTVVVVKEPEKITGVKLNRKKTVPLQTGKTLQLKATVTPSKATGATVVWKSSRRTVASVDAVGVVTGKKEGKAAITATVGGKSAKVIVRVGDAPAKSVRVKPAKARLRKGRTLRLKAVTTPQEVSPAKLTWATSNKRVATVSSKGVVKARAAGKAIISVKTWNGKTSRCTIYVK